MSKPAPDLNPELLIALNWYKRRASVCKSLKKKPGKQEGKGEKTVERKMVSTAFNIATLTLAMLLGATLQAPIESEDRAPMSNITTVVAGASLESGEEGDMNETQVSSCPNYHPGNPALRNKTGCLTGSTLDPVNHETAFGFQSGTGQHWAACGIPRIPQAK